MNVLVTGAGPIGCLVLLAASGERSARLDELVVAAKKRGLRVQFRERRDLDRLRGARGDE